MQVVSGPIGRETVHYEAPPAEQLTSEVSVFLRWFNAVDEFDPMIKAGLAHLWFVTIHPFDDGNGRISRAVGDMRIDVLIPRVGSHTKSDFKIHF